ncbi:hypothetical protein HZS_6010 [Henneguya salminicola]|nr:hypothetical protein HZS_6010 [Henneguya salminicola]
MQLFITMLKIQKTCLNEELFLMFELEQERPPNLLEDYLLTVSPLIPSIQFFAAKCTMIRRRINLTHTLSSDAAHLIIPEQYKISYRNQNFL